MAADLPDSIGRPLRADSLIECSPEKPEKANNRLPHEHCCGASKPMETTTGPQRKHASTRGMAAKMGNLPNHDGGERRREKMKRFVAVKGPRVAGAAAAIGMFIFNVVTSCS